MLSFLSCNAGRPSGNSIRVGSKKFTESVILGEIVGQLAEKRSSGADKPSPFDEAKPPYPGG